MSNVLSDLSWSREPRLNKIMYHADRATVENHDSRADFEESSRDIGSFSSANFRHIRVGLARDTSFGLLTADLLQELRIESELIPAPLLSLGAEFRKFDWLLLRSGLALGGSVALAPALGFGTRRGAFAFDLGFGYQRSLLPTSATGATFAIGFSMIY